MKPLCTLFFLGLAVMPAGASDASDIAQNRAEETGKTYQVYAASNGQVYRDVTVTKITDAGITIMHADGSLRLRHEQLTPELREKFGITKQDAEAIYAKEEKVRAAYEAHLAAKQKERQNAHEALAAKHKALFEVEQMLAEQSQAERLKAQKAEASKVAQTEEPTDAADATAATDEASIVSVLEVPKFPIIRTYDDEILRPVQGYTRSYRNRHYGSRTYGYPVRYHSGYGYGCYPRRSYYHSGHHHGYSGYATYSGSNFHIGVSW